MKSSLPIFNSPFLIPNCAFPALPEQKRIVAEVEKLENKIAAARAVLTTAPERKRSILEKWL